MVLSFGVVLVRGVEYDGVQWLRGHKMRFVNKGVDLVDVDSRVDLRSVAVTTYCIDPRILDYNLTLWTAIYYISFQTSLYIKVGL